MDGVDPAAGSTNRVTPMGIRPWEEAMRVDSPGTEVARRRRTVVAGGGGEARGVWRRRSAAWE